MTTQIRKIGNSSGIILPDKVLKNLGLNHGDTINVRMTGSSINLAKVDNDFSKWAEAYRQCKIKYDNALRELAQ